ncbi:MAG: hypothetical protein AAF548_10650 [Actinomycetota bacterium]
MSIARAAGSVIVRPALWGTALVMYVRLVPDGWWRRSPRLPVPDADMLAFRATTQYGDPRHQPEPEDLVSWLRWCKAENRRARVR